MPVLKDSKVWDLEQEWERDTRVSRQNLALMTRQLAILIDAGVTVRNSLEVIALGEADENLAVVLARLLGHVESGHSLSHGMKDFPRVFGDVYVSMVETGEETGKLVLTLQKLAGWLEEESHLLRQVRGAFVYPSLVLTVAAALTLVFFLWIFPAFLGAFSQAKTLPLLTRGLVTVSAVLSSPWFWVVAPVVGFLTLRSFREVLIGGESKARAWTIFHHSTVGALLRNMAAGRFASSMAILLETGVDLLSSFRLASLASGSPVLKVGLEDGLEFIRQGGSLPELLRSRPAAFPALAGGLVMAGHESARLPEMFDKVSELMHEDTERRVHAFTSLLEPVLVGMVGLFVALLVLGVTLPMYQMIGDQV